MQTLPFFQVDSFTDTLFKGNPAAVVVLEEWLDDSTLQKIAAENNLAETAFIQSLDGENEFHIRWFTPTHEVKLCGHATLAAAFILFNELKRSSDMLTFESLSGCLTVRKNHEGIQLDFPEWRATQQKDKHEVEAAIGASIQTLYQSDDWFAVLESEQELKKLKPNLAALLKTKAEGLIVTAKGEKTDFVYRSFFPNIGIDEDSVTGSSLCALAPYWAERMGKKTLSAYQASARGGMLHAELMADRVLITGQAILYAKGEIYVP